MPLFQQTPGAHRGESRSHAMGRGEALIFALFIPTLMA